MTALALPHRIFAPVPNTQRDTKAWIRAVAGHLRVSPSALAEAAGLSPSTVTRYLNDVSGTIGISQRSLDAIAAYSEIPPHTMPRNGSAAGMEEPEPVPFRYDEGEAAFDKAVRALVEGAPGRDPWVVRGRNLDLLGYLPGDVVIVDLNAAPNDGDVVVAQVYDWSGRAPTETVMRVFNHPYLMTASSRVAVPTPLVVDNKRVVVKGVARGLIRRTPAH